MGVNTFGLSICHSAFIACFGAIYVSPVRTAPMPSPSILLSVPLIMSMFLEACLATVVLKHGALLCVMQ